MSRPLAPPPGTPGPEFGPPPGAPAPGGPMQGTPTPQPAPPQMPSGKTAQNAADMTEITLRFKNIANNNPQAVPVIGRISQDMQELQMVLAAAAPPTEVAAPPI